jgi:hypothetical protein
MDKLIDVSPGSGFMELYDNANSQASNPLVLIIITLIFFFYFVMFSFLGNGSPTMESMPSQSGINLIEIIMWGLFIFLIMINGLQYFFDINVKTALKSISGTPEIDIQLNSGNKTSVSAENPLAGVLASVGDLAGGKARQILDAGGKLVSDGVAYTMDSAGKLIDSEGNIIEDSEEILSKGGNVVVDNAGNIANIPDVTQNNSEGDTGGNLGTLPQLNLSGKDVFHISDNKYNYTEAKAVCKAFGAELASYEDMERAYNNGAEWCGYGWSKDQLALFPTQMTTWKKLQKIEGHQNDCGRPGINGGYIDNKDIQYGVNCVGQRPPISHEEEIILNSVNPYPRTMEDKKVDNMVENYKKNIQNIKISPFNNNNWSRL